MKYLALALAASVSFCETPAYSQTDAQMLNPMISFSCPQALNDGIAYSGVIQFAVNYGEQTRMFLEGNKDGEIVEGLYIQTLTEDTARANVQMGDDAAINGLPHVLAVSEMKRDGNPSAIPVAFMMDAEHGALVLMAKGQIVAKCIATGAFKQ